MTSLWTYCKKNAHLKCLQNCWRASERLLETTFDQSEASARWNVRYCSFKGHVYPFSECKHRPLYWLVWNTVFPDMLICDSPPRGGQRTPWYPEMTHSLRPSSTSAGYLHSAAQRSAATAPPAGQLMQQNESPSLAVMVVRSESNLNDPPHAVKNKQKKKLPPALTLRHVLHMHMFHGCVWKAQNNYMRNMHSRRQ